MTPEDYHPHIWEEVQPRYIIPMHYDYQQPPLELEAKFPNVIVFSDTLESWVLPVASGATPARELTADTPESTTLSDLVATDPTTACPPATGAGTVAPAVAIYSITFVVNGVEQVVRDGDTLQALSGDEVQVREVTICAGSFSGNGGEACVDFVPVSQSGQELVSEHGGTHTVSVAPGFTTISGPSQAWTVGESWREIAVVLNHWPPRNTEDFSCGGGRCERDDRVVVGLTSSASLSSAAHSRVLAVSQCGSPSPSSVDFLTGCSASN